MTRDLHRRIDRVDRATGGGAPNVRLFFEPRPCEDPSAFARQCAAEAGKAQAMIIRFVKPGERSMFAETLQ